MKYIERGSIKLTEPRGRVKQYQMSENATGEKRENEAEKVFEEILAENAPHLEKILNYGFEKLSKT